MFATIRPRSIAAFTAGLAVAAIGVFTFQSWRAEAIDGGESTFVPIAPCRLLDTRPDTAVGPKSSPLGPKEEYPLQVTGTQGRCVGIPTQATAISINLTALLATQDTYVSVYPSNVANPGTAALNLALGQPPTPNKIDVKLSPAGKVTLFNRYGSVHIVGDVLGYYRHDGLADLQAQIHTLKVDYKAAINTLKVDLQGQINSIKVDYQARLDSINAGTSVIPSGKTVTGFEVWDQTAVPTVFSDVISVRLPARTPIALTDDKVNFALHTAVLDGDPNCVGSPSAPTAPAGKVCIYIDEIGAVERIEGAKLWRLSDTGFEVMLYTPGGTALGDDQYLWFSWAYTAP